MTWKVPLFKIYWDDDDIHSVNDAIRLGMNWAIGPSVTQFEDILAEYIGSPYCLTFNSGTSATHALLLAYEIGNGDEVIVPSFTFIATANAPQFVGAKPVFADIEDETFGLDPEDVVEKITPKTRAIMPIHFGGCPCKIRELKEIAEEYNLLLIEDAAESLGAKVYNEMVGDFGDSAMFSFCQNKIITTGEGGAIVTSSKDVFERLKLIRSHGRLETSDYFNSTNIFDYITLGYNFRMSNITAALGLSQLKKVNRIIKKRRHNAAYYIKKLKKEIPDCVIPNTPQGYFNVYQLFSIRVKRRDALIQYLEKERIMTKIYFPPIHKTHYYKNILGVTCDLPRTESIAEDIISLPFYPGITKEEMDYVVETMNKFYME